MSGKTIFLPIFRSDPISRKTLRYAIGIVMAIGVAFGFNWPLSFLAIVLAHTFLLGPFLPPHTADRISYCLTVKKTSPRYIVNTLGYIAEGLQPVNKFQYLAVNWYNPLLSGNIFLGQYQQ